VTPLYRSMLYGVAPTDFPTFALLSLLMILISMLACYIPARRATQADPIRGDACGIGPLIHFQRLPDVSREILGMRSTLSRQ
jgi:hypothetical protein